MDKQELAQRLMAAFLEELHEHVGAMNRHLLALEKNPPAEQRQAMLKELFRSAHTMKGAANANSIRPIEQFCHRLEGILVAVRDGRREFSEDLFAVCFQAADALEEAGSRLREEEDLADSPLVNLLPLIERAAAGETVPIAKPAKTQGSGAPVARPPVESHASASSAAEPPSLSASASSVKVALSQAATQPALPVPSQSVVSLTETAAFSPHVSDSASERSTATVRVPAEKLDMLLAQTGELLVARRRVESRLAEIHELRDWTAEWSAAWRMVDKPIRKLTEPSRDESRSGTAVRQALPSRAAAVLQQTGDRIRQLERRFEHLATVLRDDGRLLAQTCAALDDEVNRVRMLPFAEVCAGLERAVRDVAHSTGKQVELLVEGADVEVDRSVLEELKGPLLHLVRNAVDHGVESPEKRRSDGKSPTATVTVSAAIRGAMIEVVIADDGRGFDTSRIREIASQRGLSIPSEERDLIRLIFQAGFSTAQTVTDISGRGIGLDVVQSRIESLHGSVDVDFTPGKGSRFTLNVPLTLTTIRAVLVRVGGDTYVIPTNSVRKILRFDTSRVASVSGRSCLLNGETPIPISFLSEFVRRGPTPEFTDRKQLGIELGSAASRVVFVVDEIIAEQDVVVKSLGHRIRRIKHVSGATLLPSGRVALLLNTANLIRSALGQNPTIAAMPKTDAKSVRVRRLLVAEDSLTTRTLMKSILETAGYEVLTAADGRQAWEMLAKEPVDLVVSDVDMPRMTGFELTETIRAARQFANLPVILVTARYTDEDKARGAGAGANGYVVKSAFDQRILLETIGQLL
jgi:two-component system chemotaxis sensor kinase CheA